MLEKKVMAGIHEAKFIVEIVINTKQTCTGLKWSSGKQTQRIGFKDKVNALEYARRVEILLQKDDNDPFLTINYIDRATKLIELVGVFELTKI